MTTMPQLTIPAVLSQASVEDITWGIDCSALLTGVQTPTGVVVVLLDPSGNTVALADASTLNGNVVSQRIRAGTLTQTAGNYTLEVILTPSGTTNVFAARLLINVPF